MRRRTTGTVGTSSRGGKFCGRQRGSPGLVAALAVLLSLSLSGSTRVGSATVSGSISVSRASLRTEGPKNDLDVVVSLSPVAGDESPSSTAAAEMDQQGLVFLPHVLAIQKGTTVTFLNNDNDQHNVYFLDDNTGETLDIGTWGPGVSVDHTFDTPGMVITLCKLHLEMAAYIVVLEHPWFTRVQLDPDSMAGSFSIDSVPPGEYQVTAWHKKLKQLGGTARVGVAASGETKHDIVITPAKYARKAP
jgi:plastocyanin